MKNPLLLFLVSLIIFLGFVQCKKDTYYPDKNEMIIVLPNGQGIKQEINNDDVHVSGQRDPQFTIDWEAPIARDYSFDIYYTYGASGKSIFKPSGYSDDLIQFTLRNDTGNWVATGGVMESDYSEGPFGNIKLTVKFKDVIFTDSTANPITIKASGYLKIKH